MSNTNVRLPFLAYGMVSKWWHEYQDVVKVVFVDDASVAKMSSGDVDVEPYLNSRNTIGHGTATQILKAQSGKGVSECETNKQWWLRKVVVLWEPRQKRPPILGENRVGR